MKRILAITAAVLIMGAVISSVFLLRQSLVREGELSTGARLPELQVRFIGTEPRLARLPSKKKTLIVFFRYD